MRLDSWEIEDARRTQLDAKAVLEQDRELARLHGRLQGRRTRESPRDGQGQARPGPGGPPPAREGGWTRRSTSVSRSSSRAPATASERLDEEIAEQTPAVAKGFVAAEDVEDLELERRSKGQELAAAEIDLELVRRGATPDRLADSRLNVAQGEAGVRRATIRLDRYRAP